MTTEFKPNQLVYAYHGPLIYEAKILKIKKSTNDFIINNDLQHETLEQNPKFKSARWGNDQTVYFLHYQGWNSKWDEWVSIERIMEINEETKFKKLELDQLTKKKRVKKDDTNNNSQQDSSKSDKNGSSSKKQKTGSSSSSSTNNLTSSSSSSSSSKPTKKNVTINLQFPPELKYLLVNDWQYITKDKKLVTIPVPENKSISQIIQDYKTQRIKNLQRHQQQILEEILLGLEIYFNKSLSLILLYKYENLQYLNLLKDNIINSEIKQSKIYGLEHLLRLIISFPGLISTTTMDSISINILISELEILLQFIKDNISNYQNDYYYTSPQYDALARS
ncbi:EAF3 [Candida pseudojiufengensis]|uniref:EAF3 n=1 Tax=Candida pseudojiufengensis TaxID=497109 RepID=UPI002224F720|nr:EAF3 [Candida pseudojiufengensis]KAI5965178.1 EAF3 [Candida pseudojiufengensis]